MITLEKPLKQPTPLLKNHAVLRLLVTALLAEIGYAVLNISTMPLYLRDERGFGESVVGIVLVAFLLSEAVFKSPMGHIADRYGQKRLMVLGPGLSVFTSLASLVIPHTGGHPLEVLLFVGLRMLDGVGAAMLWPATFAAMSESVDDDERQEAMSLLNSCYMLGIALALPIGGIVNDLSHTKWASLVLSAVLFTLVSLSAWLLAPAHHRTVESAEPTELSLKEFLTSVKKIPAYLTLAVVTFAGIGFPMPIIKLFAQDQFQMSETQFGGLVFPAAIALAALSVPMSRYGERIGRTKAVHLGMGLCAIGLTFIAAGGEVVFLRQSWVLAVGAIPCGIGFLLAIPAWMASVSDINPAKRAANLGAVMTAQGLGAIIGASLGGILYEKLQPIGRHMNQIFFPDQAPISRVINFGASFGRYSPFAACAACVIGAWLLSVRILKQDTPLPDVEVTQDV